MYIFVIKTYKLLFITYSYYQLDQTSVVKYPSENISRTVILSQVNLI